MLQITATCICNAEAQPGCNCDNLLFAKQILPEVNGGLEGTPTVKVAQNLPFTAAVFSGSGSGGTAAAHLAANAFCSAAPALRTQADLEALLGQVQQELTVNAAPDTACSAAAVCICDDRLHLANLGSCRVYLVRNRAFYLLSRHSDGTSCPYGLSGTPEPGDQLLLCTDSLISALSEFSVLEQLCSASTGSGALQQLLTQARARGEKSSITAVLLRFD